MKLLLALTLAAHACPPTITANATPTASANLTWGGHTWTRGPSAYGNAANFHLVGDTLVAAETATGAGGILWLAGEHPAFIFTVQVLAEQPADGGIYVGADARGRGYQVRLDNWQHEGNLGGIYCDGVPGGIVAGTGCFAEPWLPGAWNDLKITVTCLPAPDATATAGATRIEAWVNGTQVTTFDTPTTPGARVGIQLHSNIQHDHHTPGKILTFRNFSFVPSSAPPPPAP